MVYSMKYYWNCTHINKINVHLTFVDKRTRGWLLVDSPVPTLCFILLYLFLVWIGPKFMKNRKPFKLPWLLLPYNFAMACLNAYIAMEVSFIMCSHTPMKCSQNIYKKRRLFNNFLLKTLFICDRVMVNASLN